MASGTSHFYSFLSANGFGRSCFWYDNYVWQAKPRPKISQKNISENLIYFYEMHYCVTSLMHPYFGTTISSEKANLEKLTPDLFKLFCIENGMGKLLNYFGVVFDRFSRISRHCFIENKVYV